MRPGLAGRGVAPVAALALAFTIPAASAQMSLSITMSKTPENPVLGLPFTADESVRTIQHLADGTPLLHDFEGHLSRNADGVVRCDGSQTSPDPSQPPPVQQVWLFDPAKRTLTVLTAKLMVAMVTHLPDNALASVKQMPLPKPAGGAAVAAADLVTTTLPVRTEGLTKLSGRRIETTIPVGKIGNEHPIHIFTDVWFSAQLKLMVREEEHDPRTGERTFALSNIRSEEPDPALFEIPDGYTRREQPSIPSPQATQTQTAGAGGRTQQIDEALNSDTADRKNSVAFALASNNDHLQDALTLARQAVDLVERETAIILAAGDTARSFQQMRNLTHFWDTLGWVYYRLGQGKEAAAYTRAAWDLSPNPQYGTHLARIYEAEARPDDAATIYRMCLSGHNSPAALDLLQSRVSRLSPASQDALPMEVTTALTPVNLKRASVDRDWTVDILLATAKPARVTVVSGPALPQPLSEGIASALANDLPDSGPEQVLRRARITCTGDAASVCTLHFLASERVAAMLSGVAPPPPALPQGQALDQTHTPRTPH